MSQYIKPLGQSWNTVSATQVLDFIITGLGLLL